MYHLDTMRAFIVLCCLVAKAAAYSISLSYASVKHIEREFTNLKPAFERMYEAMKPRLLRDPTKRYTEHNYFNEVGYGVMLELSWKPGDGNNGLFAPIALITSSESTALSRSFTRSTSHSSTLQETKLVDSCDRGGFMSLEIIWGRDLKTRATNSRQSKPKITLQPGDRTNVTFIDMTRNKTYHIPPEHITSIPIIRGPVNGPVHCPRGELKYNPMTTCDLPGTIISGQSIQWPNHLTSANGNYAGFIFPGRGFFCVVVGDSYKCWGSTSNSEGPEPFKAHLETDGNLCLYNGAGKNYACSGPTGLNDGQYRLIMQNDGNLVIYRGRDASQPIWASGTYKSRVSAPAICDARKS